jgi:hypothetical protein
MSTNAIDDDEDAVRRIHMDTILVAVAQAAAIRGRGGGDA